MSRLLSAVAALMLLSGCATYDEYDDWGYSEYDRDGTAYGHGYSSSYGAQGYSSNYYDPVWSVGGFLARHNPHHYWGISYYPHYRYGLGFRSGFYAPFRYSYFNSGYWGRSHFFADPWAFSYRPYSYYSPVYSFYWNRDLRRDRYLPRTRYRNNNGLYGAGNQASRLARRPIPGLRGTARSKEDRSVRRSAPIVRRDRSQGRRTIGRDGSEPRRATRVTRERSNAPRSTSTTVRNRDSVKLPAGMRGVSPRNSDRGGTRTQPTNTRSRTTTTSRATRQQRTTRQRATKPSVANSRRAPTVRTVTPRRADRTARRPAVRQTETKRSSRPQAVRSAPRTRSAAPRSAPAPATRRQSAPRSTSRSAPRAAPRSAPSRSAPPSRSQDRSSRDRSSRDRSSRR